MCVGGGVGSVTTFYDSSVTGRDTRNSPSSAQQRDKKGAAQTQHNAVLELSVLGVPGCMFIPGARAAQNQIFSSSSILREPYLQKENKVDNNLTEYIGQSDHGNSVPGFSIRMPNLF